MTVDRVQRGDMCWRAVVAPAHLSTFVTVSYGQESTQMN